MSNKRGKRERDDITCFKIRQTLNKQTKQEEEEGDKLDKGVIYSKFFMCKGMREDVS